MRYCRWTRVFYITAKTIPMFLPSLDTVVLIRERGAYQRKGCNHLDVLTVSPWSPESPALPSPPCSPSAPFPPGEPTGPSTPCQNKNLGLCLYFISTSMKYKFTNKNLNQRLLRGEFSRCHVYFKESAQNLTNLVYANVS